MLDTYAVDKVANGDYTGGTYDVDDKNKVVSYKLDGGAVSVAVIEEFVKLANHTGYVFKTKFNDKDLSVSPGMTEEQVNKNFFGEDYTPTQELDTYTINQVAHGKYTGGTYDVDDKKKVVSYKLDAGAISTAVIEEFVRLANHTGYVFKTKFNDIDLSVSPGMTEEQAQETFNKNKLKNVRHNLSASLNNPTAQEPKNTPAKEKNESIPKRNRFSLFTLLKKEKLK